MYHTRLTPFLMLVCVAAAQGPEALLQKGEYAKAAEALERLAKAPSRDPEVYIMLAVARLNLKESQGALDACERGMDAVPKSPRLQRYCSDLLFRAAPKPEIAPRLERALKADPASAVLQQALGTVLFDANPNDARAGTLLRNAATQLARDPGAHYAYGQWACLNQKETLCIAEMQKSLALADSANHRARTQAETFIAIAEEKLDHTADARAAYARALAANRDAAAFNPDAALLYVKFLLGHGDNAAAGKVVEEILTHAPGFAPARFELAKALFRDGSPEKAAGEAERALKDSGPDKTELRAMHAFLVKTYTVLGRDADAAEHQAWVEANR